MRQINEQIRLPLSVALEVVLQGIRIRLGRSIVTLMGVVLGIAFLMSILTGQIIKQGVSEEREMRAELQRMISFLEAESGPAMERTFAIVVTGPLSTVEQRFLAELDKRRPATINIKPVTGVQAAGLPDLKTVNLAGADTPFSQVADDASAIIAMGDGALPATLQWQAINDAARQSVLTTTRENHDLAPLPIARKVVLEKKARPEEIERMEADAERQKFRTQWIIVISLLVTVIGVSNAMLMSVTERFREIGTMKCLGALSAFVRRMFFLESSILGFIGSVVGAILGVLFSASVFMMTYGPGLVLEAFDILTLGGYFVFSVVAGLVLSVIAAIYPAGFASKMVPATALRSNI